MRCRRFLEEVIFRRANALKTLRDTDGDGQGDDNELIHFLAPRDANEDRTERDRLQWALPS